MRMIATLATAGLLATFAATPAMADWHGSRNHGWDRDRDRGGHRHRHHNHNRHRSTVYFSYSSPAYYPAYYAPGYYSQSYSYYEPAPIAVVPQGPAYQQPDGRYCREYQSRVTVGNRQQPSYGTACMQPDGSWEIQD